MPLPQSNYSQYPNEILDKLHELTGAQAKVISCIVRQTLGYHRSDHTLSLSFLQQATGLSRQAVSDSIKHLLSQGWIHREQVGQQYKYGISIGGETTSQLSRPELVNSVDQSRIPTSQLSRPTKAETSQLSRPELVNSVDTNKERNKERSLNKGNVATAVDPFLDRPELRMPWIERKIGLGVYKYKPEMVLRIQKHLAKYDRPASPGDAKSWLDRALTDEARVIAAHRQWQEIQEEKRQTPISSPAIDVEQLAAKAIAEEF